MSRNNGQKYRNFMAFRRKNLERQNGMPAAGGMNNQNSGRAFEAGGSHGPSVEDMIHKHKLFAMINGDKLLKYARDNYIVMGRGAVTVMGDELANYDPYASTPFGIGLMYANPSIVKMLPAKIASRAVGMVEAYDVEKMFVFLVVSTNGQSVYTFGMPFGTSADEAIDSEGGLP